MHSNLSDMQKECPPCRGWNDTVFLQIPCALVLALSACSKISGRAPPRKHALKICIEDVYWSMCSGWLSGGDRIKEVWLKGKIELCHSQDPRHTYRDLWSWHSPSWIREVSSPFISALTDHWMCNIPGRQAWFWVIPQHPRSWRMAQSWGVVGESKQQPRHQLQSTLCFV